MKSTLTLLSLTACLSTSPAFAQGTVTLQIFSPGGAAVAARGNDTKIDLTPSACKVVGVFDALLLAVVDPAVAARTDEASCQAHFTFLGCKAGDQAVLSVAAQQTATSVGIWGFGGEFGTWLHYAAETEALGVRTAFDATLGNPGVVGGSTYETDLGGAAAIPHRLGPVNLAAVDSVTLLSHPGQRFMTLGVGKTATAVKVLNCGQSVTYDARAAMAGQIFRHGKQSATFSGTLMSTIETSFSGDAVVVPADGTAPFLAPLLPLPPALGVIVSPAPVKSHPDAEADADVVERDDSVDQPAVDIDRAE